MRGFVSVKQAWSLYNFFPRMWTRWLIELYHHYTLLQPGGVGLPFQMWYTKGVLQYGLCSRVSWLRDHITSTFPQKPFWMKPLMTSFSMPCYPGSINKHTKLLRLEYNIEKGDRQYNGQHPREYSSVASARYIFTTWLVLDTKLVSALSCVEIFDLSAAKL